MFSNVVKKSNELNKLPVSMSNIEDPTLRIENPRVGSSNLPSGTISWTFSTKLNVMRLIVSVCLIVFRAEANSTDTIYGLTKLENRSSISNNFLLLFYQTHKGNAKWAY